MHSPKMDNIGNSRLDPHHQRVLSENDISNMQISRLSELKRQAALAITQEKIFTIYGTCEPVRTSLIMRGWIEKISDNRLDVRKIKIDDKSDPKIALERVLLSNFVADTKPNLIWNSQSEFTKLSCSKAKYNRIQCSHLWTTKMGLCEALKNTHWTYIKDVAEVNAPRTFSCISKADLDSFKNDYKLTACTSLLKWLITMTENKQKIFQATGTINVNIIVFAVNRCKEYLFQKQNKYLDKPILLPRTSNGQWRTFLIKYYILIAREATFKPDRGDKVPLLLEYARFILEEIRKYRPQLSCEGCNNIWIMKPAHSSRGKGIKIASKLKDLTEFLDQRKYIAQKYIEQPLLIYGTKFDIRQYYLISKAFPLEIWMYTDSYLKFSSQEYDIDNFHESIHLTNNAVQRKYKNCIKRHPKLPQDNMWSSETFKKYLIDIGDDNVWEEIIYHGMKKSILGIMTACQDSISHCFKNRFELYGCDFILDKDYKPWLIEINSCPDLSPTTTVTSIICPEVISDVIKVIIDDTTKLKTSVGKFECIHRQTHCTYSNDAKTNQSLEVYGHALPISYFYKGSTSQMESSSDTQSDITSTLQKIKIEHNNKQKSKVNDFMQKWKSYLKCDQDSRSDMSEIANTSSSSNHLGTRKSGSNVEQPHRSSDSFSSDDDIKTLEGCVIAKQESSKFDQIPSDIDSEKRKSGVIKRFTLSAPTKRVTGKHFDEKSGDQFVCVKNKEENQKIR